MDHCELAGPLGEALMPGLGLLVEAVSSDDKSASNHEVEKFPHRLGAVHCLLGCATIARWSETEVGD